MAAHRKRVQLPTWSRQKDLLSSQRNGSFGVPATPNYLLEMARTFSLERDSEPVLCARFLRRIDLLVSADTWSPTAMTSRALQGRFEEVLEAVQGKRDALRVGRDWSAAVLSFGLVRWWPSRMRGRIAQSLGPFKIVIDCQTASVQTGDGVWLADGDVSSRRSDGNGAAW